MKMKIAAKATLKAKVTRADGSVEFYDATNVTTDLLIPADKPEEPDTKPANEET